MTDDPVGVLHLRAVARRWVRRLSVRASSFIGPRLSQQGTVRPEGVEHQWRKVAASRLPPGTDRAEAVKNRDLLAAEMTPAQIAEAQRMAREWKPKKEGK